MTALEVHESNLDDIRESDGDHPNTEEQTESPQNPVGDEPKLMDLMDLYSVINEEGEDDELVGYLGAMHPIEETISGSGDEIIYCRAMDATCGDQPQLLSADSRRTWLPEDAIDDHNDQGWTWREPYGAVHQAECEDCTRYSTHLKEALGNEIPSTIAAVNYPSAMARCEFDRGWDAYEHTEVYSNWAVAQKKLGSDDSEPHYDMVYCKSMRETADREVNPKEKAHSLDPRGNHPNRACSPQGYQFSEPDDDYGPSFLYNGLAAEAAAPRVPQVEINDEWGWTPGYGILHASPCDRCEGYQQHLATAIGIGVPSAVTVGNHPQDMVWRERDRIWAVIEGARERNDWTMIQRDGEGEIALGPSMVPEAMRIPRNEEIMPREEAGSPLSPITIRAALTNNDNMSEGTVPSAPTSDAGEEQPHNRTEATVLHYRDDSVVIICSNGRETVLTSSSRDCRF